MNTGMGCNFLLQRIFLIQGLNPYVLCLLCCRWILYCWATLGHNYLEGIGSKECRNIHKLYMDHLISTWNPPGASHCSSSETPILAFPLLGVPATSPPGQCPQPHLSGSPHTSLCHQYSWAPISPASGALFIMLLWPECFFLTTLVDHHRLYYFI